MSKEAEMSDSVILLAVLLPLGSCLVTNRKTFDTKKSKDQLFLH